MFVELEQESPHGSSIQLAARGSPGRCGQRAKLVHVLEKTTDAFQACSVTCFVIRSPYRSTRAFPRPSIARSSSAVVALDFTISAS